MAVNKPISKGYVYSMGGGLLRYERQVHVDHKDPNKIAYEFTVVKPLRSVTREVKDWDAYRVRGWEIDRNKSCIYFKRGIFKLLKFEPTYTVLFGADD